MCTMTGDGALPRPLRWRVWKCRMVATQTPPEVGLPLHTWIRPAGLLISPPGKGPPRAFPMSPDFANSQVLNLVTFGSCQPHFWSPHSPCHTRGLSPWWAQMPFLGRGNVNNLCKASCTWKMLRKMRSPGSQTCSEHTTLNPSSQISFLSLLWNASREAPSRCRHLPAGLILSSPC